MGVRVVLIDSRETYPACFKAEKIEPDQAELFRKFGLLEGLLPFASRIQEVVSARHGHPLWTSRVEQYGISYQDMVNAVREQIPPSVACKIAQVRDITPGPDISRVTLMGGEPIATRLVVLACGTRDTLCAGLGLSKHMICTNHSFAIGFNIVPDSAHRFPDCSDRDRTRVAFLTLFPIRDVMRANFFVYRSPGEVWVRRFGKEPYDELLRSLPQLDRVTGPFRITSRVEMSPIDLYRVEDPLRPGLVLIGDAYQSVCPITGTGLSKVLTDVDVLCNECVPEWLATSGLGTEKIARYYDHPRKVTCDGQSLRTAEQWHTVATHPALRWRIHRQLRHLGLLLMGWAMILTRTVGAALGTRSTL
jgi:2-polyprenyl-6-methoxyphenol hydroxylase-like FAD-dependent oxidoreductase